MIVAALVVLGLCLGSFVNALVWRLHEQTTETAKHKPDKAYLRRLSIKDGRSICPHCHHELAARDLIPVVSWLTLAGKCRYCGRPIGRQYPLVEAATTALFVASYLWWPTALSGAQTAIFVLWLVLLTGFMALLVYDVRWQLLPNKLIYPLMLVAFVSAVLGVATADRPALAFLDLLGAVVIGGGLFYVIFQVSSGKWIGGGDVRLGWLLGLTAGTPGNSLLFIFLAAIGGSLLSIPLLASGRLKRDSAIPFGPFLIVGAIIARLFGAAILHWYSRTFIDF